MADILGGRFGRYVQALFNLNQPLTLGQAIPDVLPVIDLEQPRVEGELFLGNDLCSGFVFAPAVAAQLSSAILALPAASGKIAVLERMTFTVQSAQSIQVGLGASTVPLGNAATTTAQLVDARGQAARPRAACLMRTHSSAVAITSNPFFAAFTPANDAKMHDVQVVLANVSPSLPVSFVIVEGTVVNQGVGVTFQWRERPIGQQEATA